MISIKQFELYAKKKRILIVDDNSLTLKIMLSSLRKYFTEIIVARNGLDAFEIYKKDNNFDIVISDIIMPKMNGVQLAKEIKRIDEKQAFVIFSAGDDSKYYLPLFEIGINSFIPKPFIFEKVAEKLLMILENQYYHDIIHNILDNDTKNKSSVQSVIVTKDKKEVKLNIASVKEDKDKHSIKTAKELFKYLQKDRRIWQKSQIAIKTIIEDNYQLREEREKLTNIYIDDDLSYADIDEILLILERISKIFANFNFALNEFLVFEEIGDTIFDFHLIFLDYTYNDKITTDEIDVLSNIEFLLEDISTFIDTVFISKTSTDIFLYNVMFKDALKQIKESLLEYSDTTTIMSNNTKEIDFF
jgi:CheY-like chemotaxis protein